MAIEVEKVGHRKACAREGPAVEAVQYMEMEVDGSRMRGRYGGVAPSRRSVASAP